MRPGPSKGTAARTGTRRKPCWSDARRSEPAQGQRRLGASCTSADCANPVQARYRPDLSRPKLHASQHAPPQASASPAAATPRTPPQARCIPSASQAGFPADLRRATLDLHYVCTLQRLCKHRPRTSLRLRRCRRRRRSSSHREKDCPPPPGPRPRGRRCASVGPVTDSPFRPVGSSHAARHPLLATLCGACSARLSAHRPFHVQCSESDPPARPSIRRSSSVTTAAL